VPRRERAVELGHTPAFRDDVGRILEATRKAEKRWLCLALKAWLEANADRTSDGRMSRTDEEIGRAIGATPRQVAGARAVLVDLGIVEVESAGRYLEAQALLVTCFRDSQRNLRELNGSKTGAERELNGSKKEDEKRSSNGSTAVQKSDPGAERELNGSKTGAEREPIREEREEEEKAYRCTAAGCDQPADVGDRCFFCAEIWAPWEAARKRRGCGGSGKKPSRKAWEAALRRRGSPTPSEIAAKLQAFAAIHLRHQEADGWLAPMPHLKTWLNGDGWDDDLPVVRPHRRRSAEGVDERRRDELMSGSAPVLSADQRAEQRRQAQEHLRRDLETIRDHLARLPNGHPELVAVLVALDSDPIDFDEADALLHRLGADENLVGGLQDILGAYAPIDF